MGLCVFNWIIPFHCPFLLGCVDKTMCSNDGTLIFEVFFFSFYLQNNHSHLFVLCV